MRTGKLSADEKLKIQELYLTNDQSVAEIAKKIRRQEYIVSRYINTFVEKVTASIETKDKKRKAEEESEKKKQTKELVAEGKRLLKEKGLTDIQIENRIHIIMSQSKPPKKVETLVERAMKLSPITESMITRSAGANRDGNKRQVAVMTEGASQKIDEARSRNKGTGRLGKHIFKIRDEEEGRY